MAHLTSSIIASWCVKLLHSNLCMW